MINFTGENLFIIQHARLKASLILHVGLQPEDLLENTMESTCICWFILIHSQVACPIDVISVFFVYAVDIHISALPVLYQSRCRDISNYDVNMKNCLSYICNYDVNLIKVPFVYF